MSAYFRWRAQNCPSVYQLDGFREEMDGSCRAGHILWCLFLELELLARGKVKVTTENWSSVLVSVPKEDHTCRLLVKNTSLRLSFGGSVPHTLIRSLVFYYLSSWPELQVVSKQKKVLHVHAKEATRLYTSEDEFIELSITHVTDVHIDQLAQALLANMDAPYDQEATAERAIKMGDLQASIARYRLSIHNT